MNIGFQTTPLVPSSLQLHSSVSLFSAAMKRDG
uniref:Uncharacterized protein n=1 Tax=Nelumbo nucifera TaxID=4432 RepID=A0A822YAK6_NELNU|nr:TPA_asm: hypothetical protein HUJ06_029503 [Nelumbo nucifera]